VSGRAPRVTATYEIDSHFDNFRMTPAVRVEAAFDLDDRDAARDAFEAAVARVRSQIEETS
jgi:hypothetical protein